MYAEEDLLPISALQHLLFCRRQCALIHLERLWAENRLTVEGRQVHEKTHSGRGESRPGVRISRTLPLRSLELGLAGQADVVEFHHQPDGREIPLPVEYKRGRAKKDASDKVQLCAQGLCLEEMLQVSVPAGALFYVRTRRRLEVPFDDALRELTKRTITDLHAMMDSGKTPPAIKEKKCERCSLLHLCLPESFDRSASVYLQRSLAAALRDGPSAMAEDA